MAMCTILYESLEVPIQTKIQTSLLWINVQGWFTPRNLELSAWRRSIFTSTSVKGKCYSGEFITSDKNSEIIQTRIRRWSPNSSPKSCPKSSLNWHFQAFIILYRRRVHWLAEIVPDKKMQLDIEVSTPAKMTENLLADQTCRPSTCWLATHNFPWIEHILE